MHEFSNKYFIELLSLSVLILIIPTLLISTAKPKSIKPAQGIVLTPTPTPFDPFPYTPPHIPRSRAYRIMLVGDSMIAVLGPNAQLLRQHLIEYYPEHEFVNYNYGFGATSIETLPERLTNETEYQGQNFPSVLSQGFDLIIIESFAYNPLSQNKASEGVLKHIAVLDQSVRTLIKERPEAVVAIMTPIAPSKTRFAQGVYDLSASEREKWAEERLAYIKAVTGYAKENKIPLINVYEKSLNEYGEANLVFINPDDYIHPSSEGVDLMAKTIADFVYTNSIFPH